jgi:hypothetical protein
VKRWQRALGSIRVLGPDIEPFREDVQYVYEYIERLEEALGKIAHWRELAPAEINEIADAALRGEGIVRDSKLTDRFDWNSRDGVTYDSEKSGPR